MYIIHYCMAMCRALSIEQIAVVLFIAFMLLEWLSSKFRHLAVYHLNDSIQNFAIGAISFVFDYLFSILSLPLLVYTFNHHRLLNLPNSQAVVFCLLFILVDLTEYWFHRWCHQINVLWKAHVVHHQSEEFNLSVGLRTSLFIPFFNIFLYALFPLIGFAPEQVLLILFIQGFFQLLVHTRLVNTLGVLEYIFVTPSAHRVHHGKNEIYLDKNYGKFFIIWDIVFGTYQKEIEPVQFGVKGDKKFNNAFHCIIKPYTQLLQVLTNNKNRKSRNKLLFGRPEEADLLETGKHQNN